MLKRPLVQALVAATVVNEEADFRLTNDGIPDIQTSHRVLFEFHRQHAAEVHVEIFSIQAFIDDWDCVKVQLAARLATGSISSVKVVGEARPVVKMPASLRARPKRKRNRKRKAAGAKPKAEPRRAASYPAESALQGAAAGSCSSDGAREVSQNSSSETDNDKAEVDLMEDTEVMVPPSAIVAAEEKVVAAHLASVEEHKARDMSAEEIRLQEMPPPARQSSYFSKKVGLVDASCAPTGRAVCLCCKKLIAKGTVRFSYFYSTVRPHGWIHAHCTVQHVITEEKKNSIGDAIKVVQGIAENCRANSGAASEASSSKSQPVVSEILSWVSKILPALQKHQEQQQADDVSGAA